MNKSSSGRFNKFHLSNIGDWMGPEEYAGLPALVGPNRFPFYDLVVME